MKFYYIDDVTKQQCGPFELRGLSNKNIRPETMVWRPGMPDWTQAKNVADLAFLFDSSLPIPDNKPEPPRRPIDISKPEQAQQQQPTQSNQSNYQPQNRQTNTNRQPSEQNRWDDILPMPKNWLVESILLSIFCCSPISVVGIFYASRVETLYYAKDYEGALRASKNAKNWTLAGLFFLPVCYILLFMLGMVGSLAGL